MRPYLLLILLFLASFSVAQTPAASRSAADDLPKLQHLTADQVNPQIDPCADFYQYTCSKFFAANPIPPDRAAWGVIGPLSLWNEVTLRQVLEASAAKKQGRTAAEQKVGDYWTACMDENAVEKASPAALKVELDRINKMTNKSQLAEQIAHQHMLVPGAWEGDDAATFAPVFGFGSNPD